MTPVLEVGNNTNNLGLVTATATAEVGGDAATM